MKKLLSFLILLIPLFNYGQQNNTTNTKFVNGLQTPSGATEVPTSGLTAGALFYKTGTGLRYYDGSQWVTIASASSPFTLAAIGSSPNANGATLSSGTFNLQPASASFGGVVTTGSQTFAGAKNFTGGLQLNGVAFATNSANINFLYSASTGFAVTDNTGGTNLLTVANTTGNTVVSGTFTTAGQSTIPTLRLTNISGVSGGTDSLLSKNATTNVITKIPASYYATSAGYVPYTGATTTLTMGSHDVIAGNGGGNGGFYGDYGVFSTNSTGNVGSFENASATGDGVNIEAGSTLASTHAALDVNSYTGADIAKFYSDVTAFSVPITVATSLTTPLLIGGSAAGSNITYKSTTGTGTAAGIAHQFTGGTNGGTVLATMLNNGKVGIGAGAVSPRSKFDVWNIAGESNYFGATGIQSAIFNSDDSWTVNMNADNSGSGGQFNIRTSASDFSSGTLLFQVLQTGVVTIPTSLTISTLTSGRIPFASTAGLLTDAASLTYSSGTQTLTTGAGGTGVSSAVNTVNAGSGASSVAGVVMQRNSVDKYLMAVVGATDQLITGSVANDVTNRTPGGKFLWSTDDGTTANMVLSGSKLMVGTTGGLGALSINGGAHIGGTTDAGDNNLIVDGTSLLTGAITGSNLAGSGNRFVQASSTGVLSATVTVAPNISASVYTPTLTNGANVTSSTATPWASRWMRIDSNVVVEGHITITPTAGGSASTVIDVSLPVSSNLGATTELSGTGIYDGTTVTADVFISGSVANDRAILTFLSPATSSGVLKFQFMYRVQ